MGHSVGNVADVWDWNGAAFFLTTTVPNSCIDELVKLSEGVHRAAGIEDDEVVYWVLWSEKYTSRLKLAFPAALASKFIESVGAWKRSKAVA